MIVAWARKRFDLAQHVADRFAVTVHPRSIERALARQEKKRQR
jgi:hypothetical protein